MAQVAGKCEMLAGLMEFSMGHATEHVDRLVSMTGSEEAAAEAFLNMLTVSEGARNEARALRDGTADEEACARAEISAEAWDEYVRG